MMQPRREMLVIADQEGHIYLVPQQAVERGRVPDEHRAAVLQRLRAWGLPGENRPVRSLGWIAVEELTATALGA